MELLEKERAQSQHDSKSTIPSEKQLLLQAKQIKRRMRADPNFAPTLKRQQQENKKSRREKKESMQEHRDLEADLENAELKPGLYETNMALLR